MTLVNTSALPQAVEVLTRNFGNGSRFYGYSLEGRNDNGEFFRKVLVNREGPAVLLVSTPVIGY